MYSKPSTFFKLLKETAINWWARDPFRDSATIAYYTIFSLPGLMIVVISLAGYFFGSDSVTRDILVNIEATIGKEAAVIVEKIISNTQTNYDLTFTSIAGALTLLFGATAVFAQLQKTLNSIWDVEPKPKKVIFKFIKDRIFSFGIIITIGFLMLISLTFSTLISAFSEFISHHFSLSTALIIRLLDVVLSLAALTILFAAIFRILPDVVIGWRDVFAGALLTSFLFAIGKFSIALYLAHSDPTSVYGAAGSIVLVMLWVSYATLIVLFGAEFTHTNVVYKGKKIQSSDIAEKR